MPARGTDLACPIQTPRKPGSGRDVSIMTLSSTRPAPTMLIARRVSLAHRASSALYCFLQDAFAFLSTALYCNNSPSAKLTVRSPGHILRPKQASGNRGIGTTTP
jgi:hypothetical protein